MCSLLCILSQRGSTPNCKWIGQAVCAFRVSLVHQAEELDLCCGPLAWSQCHMLLSISPGLHVRSHWNHPKFLGPVAAVSSWPLPCFLVHPGLQCLSLHSTIWWVMVGAQLTSARTLADLHISQTDLPCGPHRTEQMAAQLSSTCSTEQVRPRFTLVPGESLSKP